MGKDWLSVEEVAERLGLHVRTVRGYIRDGRLKAVRIGKQYRIAPADLDAFTGRPARPDGTAVRAYTVVEFDGIPPRSADRLSTLVVAGVPVRRDTGAPLRAQAVYDDTRAHLKIIIFGGVAATADVLHAIDGILTAEDGNG